MLNVSLNKTFPTFLSSIKFFFAVSNSGLKFLNVYIGIVVAFRIVGCILMYKSCHSFLQIPYACIIQKMLI